MNRMLHREDGAVAVVVAIFMAFAVLGLAAAAIDLGSLWSDQRAKVTDTDAMALAGAQVAGKSQECTPATVDSTTNFNANAFKDAEPVYDRVVEVGGLNGVPEAAIDYVEIRCEGFRTIVEVVIEEDGQTWFSDAGTDVVGLTTAVSGGTGFSGLAFCENYIPDGPGGLDSVMDFDDLSEYNEPWQPGDGVAALDVLVADSANGWRFTELPYGANFQSNQNSWPDAKLEMFEQLCPPEMLSTGAIPGGWGWLEDADQEVEDLLPCLEGPTLWPWCRSNTGTNEMNQWPFSSGDIFNFPVFDLAQGQGSNGEFSVVGIGQAMLIGCAQNPNNDPDRRADGGDAPFVGSCGGNTDYVSFYWLGYSPIDEADLLQAVNPPPRICGVRGNGGTCL